MDWVVEGVATDQIGSDLIGVIMFDHAREPQHTFIPQSVLAPPIKFSTGRSDSKSGGQMKAHRALLLDNLPTTFGPPVFNFARAERCNLHMNIQDTMKQTKSWRKKGKRNHTSRATIRAWPTCSCPVTFGGGMTIVNFSACLSSAWGLKKPLPSHHAYLQSLLTTARIFRT